MLTINKPQVDWLTVGTFDIATATNLARIYVSLRNRTRSKDGPTKRMQYVGRGFQGVFLGAARQGKGNQVHTMMQVSGELAHLAYLAIRDEERKTWAELNCSRIDVQLTIRRPDDYDSLVLFEACNGQLPSGRSTTLIKSGNGMDTVYFGSRTTKHGRITRTYVKEDSDHNLYLRFEVEYKKTWAQSVFRQLLMGDMVKNALVMELETIPGPPYPLSLFLGMLDGTLPMHRPEHVATDMPAMQWLLNVAEPVMRKAANDHENSWQFRRWLAELKDELC